MYRLLTLKLGVMSSAHIHLSTSGLPEDRGRDRGCWSFLKFVDMSPHEASTVMLGSFTQRYVCTVHCIVHVHTCTCIVLLHNIIMTLLYSYIYMYMYNNI